MIRLIFPKTCGDIARTELREPRHAALDLLMAEPCGNDAARDDLARPVGDVPLAQAQNILPQRIRTYAQFLNIGEKGFIFPAEPTIERDQPLFFQRKTAVALRQSLRFLCEP